MILFIDNYDSFTYNIVQYLQVLQQEVKVFKNDELTTQDIMCMAPSAIIIGPGPCTPNESGVSINILTELANDYPILGICLGHQAIGQVFGADITNAKQVMHGRTSDVFHLVGGVFNNLPSPFKATRYHSLVIDADSLPNCLEITAWTQDTNGNFDEVMGIRHKTLDIEGVQFHPESILSEHGYKVINNFLQQHNLAKIDSASLPTLSN